jgi:hypothetical protein
MSITLEEYRKLRRDPEIIAALALVPRVQPRRAWNAGLHVFHVRVYANAEERRLAENTRRRAAYRERTRRKQ